MGEKKNALEQAVTLIEAQQAALNPYDPAFMVGEQLKEMCRRIPGAAELIAQDVEREGMRLVDAEGMIRKRADEVHAKGRGAKGSIKKKEAHDKTDEAKEKDAKAGRGEKGKADAGKAAMKPSGGAVSGGRGDAVCISPREAEEILRKFYGIPEDARRDARSDVPVGTYAEDAQSGGNVATYAEDEDQSVPGDDFIDLDSFL